MKKTIPRRVRAQTGLRIVQLRNERGLTQEELAEKAGISARQMQRFEAGDSNINVVNLTRLAAALDVEPAALLSAPAAGVKRSVGRPQKPR